MLNNITKYNGILFSARGYPQGFSQYGVIGNLKLRRRRKFVEKIDYNEIY